MEVLCKLTRKTKAIFGLCSTHVSKLIYGTDINNLRENYKQDRLFQTTIPLVLVLQITSTIFILGNLV